MSSRTRAAVVLLFGSGVFLLFVQPAALASRHPTLPRTVRGSPGGAAAPGGQLWARRYNGPGNAEDPAHCAIADQVGIAQDASSPYGSVWAPKRPPQSAWMLGSLRGNVPTAAARAACMASTH